MHSGSLTRQSRDALLHFELVYDDWRQATDAWLTADLLLWTQALADPGAADLSRLGDEAACKHNSARIAYLSVIEALLQNP